MKNKNLIIAIGLFIAGLIVGSYGGRLVELPLVGMHSDAFMAAPKCPGGPEYAACSRCIKSGGSWVAEICTYAARNGVDEFDQGSSQ